MTYVILFPPQEVSFIAFIITVQFEFIVYNDVCRCQKKTGPGTMIDNKEGHKILLSLMTKLRLGESKITELIGGVSCDVPAAQIRQCSANLDYSLIPQKRRPGGRMAG